ncbi:MAG: hypothetical protein GF311_28295 [Candidatus Lokiarchaeota archaeon]|nr:hypothetical protein [Candidatus Lokiarchaeota archaeon]
MQEKINYFFSKDTPQKYDPTAWGGTKEERLELLREVFKQNWKALNVRPDLKNPRKITQTKQALIASNFFPDLDTFSIFFVPETKKNQIYKTHKEDIVKIFSRTTGFDATKKYKFLRKEVKYDPHWNSCGKITKPLVTSNESYYKVENNVTYQDWFNHLFGTVSISLPGYAHSTIRVIDVDCKNKKTDKEMAEIIDIIIANVGIPFYIEKSEESRGYHLFYNFDGYIKDSAWKALGNQLNDICRTKKEIECRSKTELMKLPFSYQYRFRCGTYNKKSPHRIKDLGKFYKFKKFLDLFIEGNKNPIPLNKTITYFENEINIEDEVPSLQSKRISVKSKKTYTTQEGFTKKTSYEDKLFQYYENQKEPSKKEKTFIMHQVLKHLFQSELKSKYLAVNEKLIKDTQKLYFFLKQKKEYDKKTHKSYGPKYRELEKGILLPVKLQKFIKIKYNITSIRKCLKLLEDMGILSEILINGYAYSYKGKIRFAKHFLLKSIEELIYPIYEKNIEDLTIEILDTDFKKDFYKYFNGLDYRSFKIKHKLTEDDIKILHYTTYNLINKDLGLNRKKVPSFLIKLCYYFIFTTGRLYKIMGKVANEMAYLGLISKKTLRKWTDDDGPPDPWEAFRPNLDDIFASVCEEEGEECLKEVSVWED